MSERPKYGPLTCSVHGQIKALDLTEASKYFIKMILRNVLRQLLDNNLKTSKLEAGLKPNTLDF